MATITGDTPEAIAFALMETIAKVEQKTLEAGYSAPATANREWILTTYAQCIVVVKGGDPKHFTSP